jgi:hypothetical protein
MVIVAVGALVTQWINAGNFSKEIAIALVGLLAQAAATYLVPNQDTSSGVPVKQSNE